MDTEELRPLAPSDVNPTQPRWGLFNVIIMATSFLFLFSGFNTASAYLTTALPQDIGFYSLSILYATFALTNFISAAVVKKIGPRISMILAAALYLAFIAAAVKIIVPVYLFASALCGVGAAILWTAQGAFLTNCSSATNMSFHTGLFFAIFQANSLVGYPIAAVLVHRNLSFATIFSVLFLIAASGAAGLLLLRRLEVTVIKKREPITKLLFSTALLFNDRKTLAMVVLIFYSGFSSSFFVGLFPKAMGKERIAWAQMCFGIAEVVGSFAAGQLSGIVGRVPVFAFSIITHITALIFVYWSQYYSITAVYFLASTMFGFGDSTLQTTMYSVLTNLYPGNSESAFAYYKFSQSLGYTICLLISIPLQHSISLMVILLASILIVAIINMSYLHYKIVNIDFNIEHL